MTKTPNDLLVIGAGELGSRIAIRWRKFFPDARVICETRSARRHLELSNAGCFCRLREDPMPEPVANVMLAIPPSQISSIKEETERTVNLWQGTGCLLQISSTGVYAEEGGGEVRETSPLGDSERVSRLLSIEEGIARGQGTRLRLAGLYCATQGPHLMYARSRTSQLNGGGWINLIHYDDAASLAVSLLQLKLNAIYLGCDDEPIRRRDLASLATSGGQSVCTFSDEGSLGKRCTNEWTRQQSHWHPRWKSFAYWHEATNYNSAPV